jgi:integrase
VPLSNRALEIIEQQRATTKDPAGYIFPGRRAPMGGNVMRKTMFAVNGKGPVPHGLRSSFRDWCGENGYPRDLAELSLSHVVGSAVERAYRRSKLVGQRREIMDAWTRYCDGRA